MSVPRTTLVAAALLATAACANGKDAGSGPYAREVAEAIPRIEQATGLKFKTPPKVEVRTRDQVREFLLKQMDDATPATSSRRGEGVQAAAPHPDTMDLRGFFVRVLTEQVVGYYDPKAKTLYVVDGADEQVVGITITHELIHALQDQYVDLDSIQKSGSNNDRLAAAQALIEGEAQFEQISIMLGGPDQIEARLPGRWDRVREEIRNRQGEMPVFATAPMVIQESLLFPYLSGAEFVRRVKEKRGSVDLFRDIPRSTEQILHPPSFLGAPPDEPTSVTLPAPRGATKTYENDMGEFGTRLVVYAYLRDPQTSQRAAAGWDGDRFMVVEKGTERGLVWALVWDSPLEAAEFSDAMIRAAMRRTGAPERRVATGGATFAYQGRTISVLPVSIGDRAVVVYMDLPDSMGSVIDPSAVTVGK
jgi:hypothetical protein